MTTTTPPLTLEATSPAYLEARADATAARKALRGRQHVPAGMVSANADHAQEVREKQRTGTGRLVTNTYAHQNGAGGFEVIYHARCDCLDTDSPCVCDPLATPYSDEEISAAEMAVTKAETALATAETKLAGVAPTIDVFENARRQNAPYVWWPQDRSRDPRTHRWQGQPLTAEEVAGMGPHSLRRAITTGAVLEVPGQ